ncbi:PREDICTED: leucine-rich repeat-containing protein 49 [Dufourea novaeangliae]|uniref:Dynein axonemal assembly factor 1 homolog n=1 Tax=Dufourea novaeangliae TaxID=178035 RepID=A0A154P3N8_DUFNO|nr:PREDICTED: leucine-rich repeat-containing protein 49 [Dufourea novaeangliae]KZC06559.1 Leucine-rich repeat-containing protein 49 [Dufourea novaeangliae]
MIEIRLLNLWHNILIIFVCFGYVMPISNDRATRIKTLNFDIRGIKGKSTETKANVQQNTQFLTIAPALPILPGAPIPPKLSKRCYNSFSPGDSAFNTDNAKVESSNAVTLQWTSEGKTMVATRTVTEKEKSPDRICLDRRGLTTFPNIVGEPRLRLLSLQHNLLTKIENCNFSQLTKLVFLDLYDNQIEKICNFEVLENLRVLLIGKNRIRRVEGLKQLSKLEVLDLHGNQILQVSDLETLASLKVLNLAGNNIKAIGYHDFQGLASLKELNLRRNKIKKLLGFGETPQLQKLYLSNNDIQKIEDLGSLAKALQLREVTIDGNPVTLNGDYVSFLVSYLPNLQFLSTMPVTEQIRRSAMAWKTTKEQSNSTFLSLSAQVCMNVRREEVISNAKINWELLRCHSKSSADNNGNNIRNNNIGLMQVQKSNKFNTLKPKSLEKVKSKGFGSLTSINENIEATKINIKKRSNSTDNLFRLKDTTKTYPLEFKLPPILGSIVDNLINNKFDEKAGRGNKSSTKAKISSDADSESNSDSESSESHENLKSCLKSHLINNYMSPRDANKFDKKIFSSINVSSISTAIHEEKGNKNYTILESTEILNGDENLEKVSQNVKLHDQHGTSDCQSKSSVGSSGYFSLSSKTNSVDSCKSVLSDSSISSATKNVLLKCKNSEKDKNRIKSAQVKKIVSYKSNRAATARAKYRASTPPSPPPMQNLPKEREQGGDYLIEIVGRCLNVYGQGALRFIDKPWDCSKAQDVNVVKFNYVQFNDVAKVLCKVKNRFPNIEHFTFKETNISYLGQLNALAEVQGLTSIQIEIGNPIISKDWKVYAIFRLAHWGLKIINGKEITNEEIEMANKEYAGLVDIVMCSLPESLLQPLLQRLHLEKVQRQNGEQITAKQFLLNSDPALRSVVAKEALQWRKGCITQEDLIWRHRGKVHVLGLINLTIDAVQKLQLLENKWPRILCEIIHTTLSDFSEMDTYMKRCSETLKNDK